MGLAHIFFKELELEQDNIFTANFTRENETKNVIFSQDAEYAITGLRINSILTDKKLLKIENIKEQSKISQEIQDLIKNYEEPDLTLFMSHPERKTMKVPFVKKNESDLPKINLTYYNTNTKKSQTFLVYDYIGHFEKFGLEWIQNDLGLKYVVKIDNSDKKKIKKQLTLSQQTRKKICLDESRVWNMENSWELNKSGTNG